MTQSDSQIRISDLIIEKFWDVFNDDEHTHKILTSGRAGTKSSEAAIETVFKIVQDIDGSAVVIRKRHNKLRKTVYKGLDERLFKITVSPMEITFLENGNTIYFTGSDNIDDTKGIIDESKPIKLVLIDEVNEFFEQGEGEDELQNIEATFIRGNDEGFQMLYLYNPPKNPNAPVVVWTRKMEQRPDCVHVHVDYRDVPPEWIGRKLLESAEILRQVDERQWRWLWLGQSIGVDELIKHKLEGLAEYYYSGRETGAQKSPSDYAGDFVGFLDDLHERYSCGLFYVYIDPSARGLMEEIKRAARGTSYTVLIRDAENDVALGISRVQKLLTFDMLSIDPGQKHAREEFGLYEYDKKSIERGLEKPVKLSDHCMDAIRYLVMGLWSKLKHFLPVQDKEDEEPEGVIK